MITDNQARRLREVMQQEKELKKSAMKSGMDEKTARKYLRDGRLPSEMKEVHAWRTRADPFESVWDEVVPFLKENTGIEAKTLFDFLQRKYPGSFSDGQLRTFQRKVRRWRALEGPPKEVFFAQEHHPGRLCQSDFTFMNSLGVTICGEPFSLSFHFDLLELGNRMRMFQRVIRKYQPWDANCFVGTRGRAGDSSNRPNECRHTETGESRRVHASLPRVVGSLSACRTIHPGK